MNLGDMCLMAARYADRYDEFIKTADASGALTYQGEALNMFNVLRDAINEAYGEIADGYLLPDCLKAVTPNESGEIDLIKALPEATCILDVLTADGRTKLEFDFKTRFVITVQGIRPGETVIIRARLHPQRLENENDEPIFPETAAAPMIYVALAVARLMQSERKFSDAQSWLSEYRRLIRAVRSSARARRRLPRPTFR